MKRVRVLECIFLAASFLVLSAIQVGAQRKSGESPSATRGEKERVVVFAKRHDYSWVENETVAALEDAIVSGGRYSLVTGSERETLLKEISTNNSDVFDPKAAARAGRLIGAKYIILARPLDVKPKEPSFKEKMIGGLKGYYARGVKAKVQIQLIQVETGEIKSSQSYDETSKEPPIKTRDDFDAIHEGYQIAVKSIATRFLTDIGAGGSSSASLPSESSSTPAPSEKSLTEKGNKSSPPSAAPAVPPPAQVEGEVVEIKPGRIGIDIGREQSAAVGQEYMVFIKGAPIKNSKGKIVGYNNTLCARIRIAQVDASMSWAMIVETFDDTGKPDPSPRPDRVKVMQSVKPVEK